MIHQPSAFLDDTVADWNVGRSGSYGTFHGRSHGLDPSNALAPSRIIHTNATFHKYSAGLSLNCFFVSLHCNKMLNRAKAQRRTGSIFAE